MKKHQRRESARNKAHNLVAMHNDVQCGVRTWSNFHRCIDIMVRDADTAKDVVNAVINDDFTSDNAEGLAADYVAMHLIRKWELRVR